MNPTKRMLVSSVLSANSPSIKSLATLPRMSGTTIKNENRAARVRSIPRITEVEIVAPDLDMPGKMAIAWATPTINALP